MTRLRATGTDRLWWALAVMVLAELIVTVDVTIVTISLPFAQADLGIDDADKQWTITAYTLMLGGLLLLGGRLADYLGRRRIFIIGLLGFAAASALAGLAHNGIQLFLGRGFQGACAALMAPAALSLLSVTFTEPTQRARAFSVFGSVAGAGAVIGLILGGMLTEHASWRWCLFINVPLAVLGVCGALAFVRPDPPRRRPAGYDVAGAVVATLGLFALVYGFSRAADAGWSATGTIASLAAGALLLALFVVIEQRATAPLLPLRIPAESTRGGSYLTMLLLPIAMYAMFLFISYYFQTTLGYSPVRAGVAFLPFPFALAMAAGIAGTLMPRIGPRPVMVAGGMIGCVGYLLLAQLHYGADYWSGAALPIVVIAFGMGPIYVAVQTTALHRIAPEDTGVASGLINAAQQVGASVGTSLLTTVAVHVGQRYARTHTDVDHVLERASIHSYSIVFYCGAAIFALATVLMAITIRARAADLAAAETAVGAESPS